jgi:hypothetical protein
MERWFCEVPATFNASLPAPLRPGTNAAPVPWVPEEKSSKPALANTILFENLPPRRRQNRRRSGSPASAILGTIRDKILSFIFASAMVQAKTHKVKKAKIRQCLCG